MGALCYLAAWDVRRGRVFGRSEQRGGIEPFDRLVWQVMTKQPYASAKRVFWIVDNGSAHRGERAKARLERRWPNLTLVHLPVHARWLNQVEIYFSIVQCNRWPTRRKYLQAVPMAYEPLFTEDDEVVLAALFDLRNRLVHARPGTGPPMAALPDPTWRAEYSPKRVACWLIAVAGAADLMETRCYCYGFDYLSFPAFAIWQGRTTVIERGERAELLPRQDDEDTQCLVEDLNDQVGRRNKELDDVKLTVHELREARLRHAEQHGPWDAFTDVLLRQASQRTGRPTE